MTKEGWRAAILDAWGQALSGDQTMLDGLAQQLTEEDEAKQLLRNAGFGCTGVSLLRTVQEALEWIEGAHNPADGADGT